MFVSEGLRDRWRMTSSTHAQMHDESEITLPSRTREDSFSGHKLLQQFPVEVDQTSLSMAKNENCCSDLHSSYRQSGFNNSTKDRISAPNDARDQHGDHHVIHPVLSNDSSRFNSKRSIANSSPSIGSDWPAVVFGTSENTQQNSHHSCTYQSTQHHFEPSTVGMATRYDIGATYLADRFLSSSYSSASPSDHQQTSVGGVTHHGFSTPPSGSSQFYGEPVAMGGLDVGVLQNCLTPSSLECSPRLPNAGFSGSSGDRSACGLDVGVPRAAGGLTPGGGFPSMTVNLSMSMNVVETPTAARRLFQPTQQAWNVMGGLMNDDDDDEDTVGGVSEIRWPSAAAYTMHQSQQHQNHQQQQHSGYRCGGSISPRNGWRLHATPAVTYFKRSPAAADCGQMTTNQLHNGPEDYLANSVNTGRELHQLDDTHQLQSHQHSRYQSPIVHQTAPSSSFYAEVGALPHLTSSSPSKFQHHRRDLPDRSGVISRHVTARCQQRLFPAAAPITGSASSSSSSSLHPHQLLPQHQQSHQNHQRPLNSRGAGGGIRTSQHGGVTYALSSSRGGAGDAGGRGTVNGSVLSTDSLTGRPNVCRICDKTYARPSTLKTHLRTHSGEKPYTCGTCRKAFSQAANLTAHLRTHTGERPFSCPVCSRRFSQSSSVATHLRTHSGERPYRCRLCSKTFSDSSTLTKHLRIHSGEKPYQCSICLLRFSQSGNLNRHKRVHGPAK